MDSVVPIRDKYVLNTYLLNPIPEKEWIVWIIMPIKPDTCWGVCNMPLPIRDKYLINTYLLNPIPEKDRIVWIIMPIKPGTFLDVCNTPLPIRDKYLINTYLLYLISGKDWMVRVKAYCIRLTNAHDYGQMIDSHGTFWGVCNTPLPIRIKNLIPIYQKNLKPCTCQGVCNTSLYIRDKCLINMYLLNPIIGKD